MRVERDLEVQRIGQEIKRLRAKGEFELADLLEREKAVRRLIEQGADPALMLSYVIWPSPAIEEALRERRAA